MEALLFVPMPRHIYIYTYIGLVEKGSMYANLQVAWVVFITQSNGGLFLLFFFCVCCVFASC